MPEGVTKAPKHRPLDDETRAALTLYNTYLIADREQQAHQRALKKAEKAKDDAAAAVRKAPTAAAEAKYRETVEALRRLRDGEAATPQDPDDGGDKTASDAEDQDAPTEKAEDAPTEEDTPTEKAEDTATEEDTPTAKAEDTDSENVDEASSVGVEASVDDEDLAGDEPAGVAG